MKFKLLLFLFFLFGVLVLILFLMDKHLDIINIVEFHAQEILNTRTRVEACFERLSFIHTL